MIRRHLVRGYNEKIFYAESQGITSTKIYQLTFHNSTANEIVKKEIFTLTGSLVAFEADSDCIQNDMKEGVTQSLFIMDDGQKITLLKNEDNVKFTTKKVIDFSLHNKLQEVNALRDNDWSHAHITDRTLTFNDTTYNLNSNLQLQFRVPKYFFG